MTTPPATNLDDAWRACNPDMPLQPDDDRYVDLAEVRGESKNIIKSIQRGISRSENMHCKFLVSGHRGCGKSTELLRLKSQLDDANHFCVYLDVGNLLDLGDVKYIDVFIAIVEKVAEQLNQNNINIPDDMVTHIENWVNQTVSKESVSTKSVIGSLESEAKVGGAIPVFSLMSRLRGQMKLDSYQRESIREDIAKKSTDFIQLVNQFLMSANSLLNQHDKQALVVIADGLEKISYRNYQDGNNSHTEMFVKHAEQLKALRCHVVYTMPITLAYSNYMSNDFDRPMIIPMVNLDTEKGEEKLRELLSRRMTLSAIFINLQDVNRLIKISGGATRDLMKLVRLATDTDDEKITTKLVDIAINDLSKEYNRLIADDDLASLHYVYQNKWFDSGDERTNQLLVNRAILEYENGKSFAKIHPALLRIERIEKALGIDNSQTC